MRYLVVKRRRTWKKWKMEKKVARKMRYQDDRAMENCTSENKTVRMKNTMLAKPCCQRLKRKVSSHGRHRSLMSHAFCRGVIHGRFVVRVNSCCSLDTWCEEARGRTHRSTVHFSFSKSFIFLHEKHNLIFCKIDRLSILQLRN